MTISRVLIHILIGYDSHVQGKVRLVVDVESADIMATLLRLKGEVEHKIFNETNQHTKLKLTFSGATEAHVLARELRHAKVGVLVRPRPYPYAWDSRRMYVSHLICKHFTQVIGLLQYSWTPAYPPGFRIVPHLPGNRSWNHSTGRRFWRHGCLGGAKP